MLDLHSFKPLKFPIVQEQLKQLLHIMMLPKYTFKTKFPGNQFLDQIRPNLNILKDPTINV